MITQKLLKNSRPDLLYRSDAPWHPLNTPRIKNSRVSIKTEKAPTKPVLCESILKVVTESSKPKFTPSVSTTNSNKTQTPLYFLSMSEQATRSFLNIYLLTFATNPATIASQVKCKQEQVMILAKNFSLFFPKAFYNTPLGSLDATNLKISIQIMNNKALSSIFLPIQSQGTKKTNSFRNILREVEQSAKLKD